MKSIVLRYTQALSKHPFAITMATTGTISCFGDLIAQQIIEQRGFQNHQIRRTLKLTCMGFFMVAPTLRCWYLTLDKLFKGNKARVAIQKMILDQTLFAPFFIGNFLIVADALENKSIEQIIDKLKSSYFQTLTMNWFIWPPVQIANFYYIPLEHRVLFSNMAALIWNTYLSWVVNKKN
ncbi:protein Mpv17 isoform X2 [Hydra vulgaris]|uniref:Mitochondrial inner membrane protein Mpv17 n=1 Tax=Hydra vulgaris TaxID=6087 RepID=A0ABM4BP40_HYDVU